METNMGDFTMFTRSGAAVNPLDVRHDQVLITDIAHSLAMQCRYGGHSAFFYSVAQHSWLLSLAAQEVNRDLARAALIHDAAEAYISDMVHPLKMEMPEFRTLDKKITKVIFERYGVDFELLEMLEPYDRGISINEMEVLMPRIDPYLQKNYQRLNVVVTEQSPKVAFRMFMQRFKELFPGEWPNIH